MDEAVLESCLGEGSVHGVVDEEAYTRSVSSHIIVRDGHSPAVNTLSRITM